MSDRRPCSSDYGSQDGLAGFLRVAMRDWSEAEAAEWESREDRDIGRYRLVERIGEGGFGLVWRAWQTAPIQRHVALKIIKLGMDTGQVVARFDAERQTLAMMEHPGIAAVFDAGATGSGRPYFVMELVEGPSVTAYCDQRGLDIPARLRLFVKICRAVQHAHQKGILHRDLKPGNILVAEVDGNPCPKIIDFGISRALDSAAIPRAGSLRTRNDFLLGTPDYMSPEQAILGNPDLDTRADIYSLGAILYELLTGHTPLSQSHRDDTTLDSLLRSVRHDEARRPSAVAAAPAQHLKGDLDWITLKALAKNRDDRYASAAALADDIERHLDDLPITAGPPSLAQHTRKFIRRNRALAAAVVMVAFTLIAGATLATYAFFRESLAREEAETMRRQAESHRAEAMRQRDLALSQSDKAERTLAFLNRLLEDTGTLASQGKNPEALRLALDGLSGEIEKFSDDPEVQEAIIGRAALIYRSLRDEGKAVPLVERQIRLLEQERAANDVGPLTARELYARTLYLTGRVAESHVQYDLLIDGLKSLLHTRDGPRKLFIARRNRADVWSKTGRLEEALAEFDDIKAHATDEMRNHSNWPVLQRNHAETLTFAGRWSEAEAVYNEALTGLDLGYPAHQHAASMIHAKRATLCLKQRNVPAAMRALESAINLQTRAKGPQSPWLAEWWIEVSRLYTARNLNDKAVAANERALGIVVKTGQTNRIHLAHRALGDNLEAAGRHEEAAAAYLTASDLEMQMLPPPEEAWLDSARAVRNFALSGRFDEAAACARPAEQILPSWRGDSGRQYDVKLVEIALAFASLAAAEARGEPSQISFREIGEKHGRPVITRFLKRPADKSSPAIRRVLAILRREGPSADVAAPLTAADFLAFDRAFNDRWQPGDPAAPLIELAAALRVTGRHRDAADVYRIAAAIAREDVPVSDRRHIALLLAAETLRQIGEGDEAGVIIEQLRTERDSSRDSVANWRVLAVLAD